MRLNVYKQIIPVPGALKKVVFILILLLVKYVIKDGTLNITGRTIIQNNSVSTPAVLNKGLLNIGIKDETVNKNSPIIQGKHYGVTSEKDFNYYDGIIKGANKPFNNETKIVDIEPQYTIIHSQEIINGTNYNTAYLAIEKTVTFDSNGGTLDETSRKIEYQYSIGTLPKPTRPGYDFDGWFTTLDDSGKQVTENTIVTDNMNLFAHWTEVYVSEINGIKYRTLQSAINSVPASTPTTIKVIHNSTENVTINSNSSKTAAINNFKNGNLKLENISIISTGERQAIYNYGGVLEISGNSYLSSSTKDKQENYTLDRGTIQNIENGTVIITGGTIVSKTQQAISNEGTLILGTKDGNINKTTPTVIGTTYGIKTIGTFKFYDGIIKGTF